MVKYWFPISTKWKLQDVQAGLNVVVTILSFLASFTFVRFCWQRSARKVIRGKDVALHSLLSVNTPGEAFDVIFLLHKKLFTARFAIVLIQCIVILCLSSAAILSGLIARFSAKLGSVYLDQEVSGFLVGRNISSIGIQVADINRTYSQLEAAGFPRNQLLDYRPAPQVDWIYYPTQWNNSWTMNCQPTPRTPIEVNATRNCTDNIWDELPALRVPFNIQPGKSEWQWGSQWDGWFDPSNRSDIQLFVYGAKYLNKSQTQNAWYAMSISIGVVNIHNAPQKPLNDKNATCFLGSGPADGASYTKIDCDLRRRSDIPGANWTAAPDDNDGDILVDSYNNFYSPQFEIQSRENQNITMLTPDDLIRFYQVYVLHKDTSILIPETRTLNVKVPAIELSTIFFGVTIFVALMILFGLCYYTIWAFRHFDTFVTTPSSKIDWMMQSIEAEDRPSIDVRGEARRNVTVGPIGFTTSLSHFERMCKEFEVARYGRRETSTWFLRDAPTPSTEYDGSTELYQTDPFSQTYRSSKFSQYIHSPKLSRNTMTSAIYPLRTLSGYEYLNGKPTDGGASRMK